MKPDQSSDIQGSGFSLQDVWIVLLLLEILGVAGRFSLFPHIPFFLITLSCFLLTFSCSFVYSSLGLTAMAFVTGALGVWMPLFLYRAQVVQGIVPPCLQKSCNSSIRWAVPVGAHLETLRSAQAQLVCKAKGRMWLSTSCEGNGLWMLNCFQVLRHSPLFVCLFMSTQLTGKMMPALFKWSGKKQ